MRYEIIFWWHINISLHKLIKTLSNLTITKQKQKTKKNKQTENKNKLKVLLIISWCNTNSFFSSLYVWSWSNYSSACKYVIDFSPENNRIHDLLNMVVKKLQSMINKWNIYNYFLVTITKQKQKTKKNKQTENKNKLKVPKRNR
jgi:hypothetical protein